MFKIDTITLPLDPSNITLSNPTVTKTATMPGNKPLVISLGLEVKTLTVEGYLYQAGKTKADLKTLYIDPLLAKLHREVTVDASDDLYDGTYVFKEFEITLIPGATVVYKYRMVFIQGSSHLVL